LSIRSCPFLSGARGYAEKGIFPGGAFDNKMHFEKSVKFSEEIDEPAQMLMFDPQTSGGLVVWCGSRKADGVREAGAGNESAGVGDRGRSSRQRRGDRGVDVPHQLFGTGI
jgi:selenophosphate synthase